MASCHFVIGRADFGPRLPDIPYCIGIFLALLTTACLPRRPLCCVRDRVSVPRCISPVIILVVLVYIGGSPRTKPTRNCRHGPFAWNFFPGSRLLPTNSDAADDSTPMSISRDRQAQFRRLISVRKKKKKKEVQKKRKKKIKKKEKK